MRRSFAARSRQTKTHERAAAAGFRIGGFQYLPRRDVALPLNQKLADRKAGGVSRNHRDMQIFRPLRNDVGKQLKNNIQDSAATRK